MGLPKPGDTLIYLVGTDRAVVLHLYPSVEGEAAPDGQAGAQPTMPSYWRQQACAWLTRDLPDEHTLWAQVRPFLEFPVRVADAESMFQRSGCLLVAAKPYSQAPAKRAKKEGWTDDDLRADSWTRLGGRIRGAYSTNHLALAAGGPDASDDDLLEAVADLREFARGLAASTRYGFITFPAKFDLLQAHSAHFRWSPEAPQAGPVELCDEVAFDAFPVQILGPGHLRRLGGIPSGAQAIGGGRVELAIGEPRSWLPTLRERGRALLAPCIVESHREAELLAHQRYKADLTSLTDEELAAVSRLSWRLGHRGRPVEEVLADPQMFDVVSAALYRARQSQSSTAREPDLVTRSRARALPIAQFTAELHALRRPARLRLYPEPPKTIARPTKLASDVLQKAGDWVARGKLVEIWGIIEHWRFPLRSEDASTFLPYCSTKLSEPTKMDHWLVGFHEGGHVRMAIDSASGAHALSLVSGRLPAFAHPIGSRTAENEMLQLVQDLIAFARTVSLEIAYGFVTMNRGGPHVPVHVDQLLCDELVFDAFPYQVLGTGHIARLGGVPPGGRQIADGKIELFIGDPIEWLPRVQDAGRKLLAPCLATQTEASAMIDERREQTRIHHS